MADSSGSLALTVMAAKGTAVLPVKPRDFTPDYSYHHTCFDLAVHPDDGSALHLGDDYILLRQDVKAERPTKVAVINELGWAAYVLNNTAFIKSFTYVSGADYVDFGSNLKVGPTKIVLSSNHLARSDT